MTEEQSFDLSKYELLSEIGSGVFSIVYKAKDKETGEIYAAKISRSKLETNAKSQIISIVREVNINGKINHPSIAKFIGFSLKDFQGEPKPVIITEFLPNGSLANLIESERKGCAEPRWNDTRKLIIIYGIASAMSFLHSHEIIHRDLKPDNILMDADLNPKITDFGLSKSDNNQSAVQSLNGIKGTPLYLPPESLLNSQYSPAGDVYAFAMITYELLTNETPFKDCTVQNLYTKLMNGQRPDFKSPIPEAYKNLIEKCWSDDPSSRPSFDEIATELRENRDFITDLIDEGEFLTYVDYINDSKSTFNSLKRLLSYKEFVQKKEENKEKVEEIEKVEDIEKVEGKNDEKKKKDKSKDAKHLYSKWKKYYYGKEVPVNKKKAAKCLKKSAEKGYVKAMFKYGMMLNEGDGIKKDDEEALKYFKMAADQEHLDAMWAYANLLSSLNPNDENIEKESIQYLKRSMDKGNVDAMAYLGIRIILDKKAQKQEEGFSYIKKAMEKDSAVGYLGYGYAMSEGICIPKDSKKSLQYFKIAADKGHIQGLHYYGVCLCSEEFGPVNFKEGHRYLKMSADKGLIESMYYYGSFGLNITELQRKDPSEYLEYVKKAADYGNPEAMNSYGLLLLEGDHLPINKEEGIKYLKMAIEKGNNMAIINLGCTYYEGSNQDKIEGYRILKMGSDKGDPGCMFLCSLKLFSGEGVPLDKSEALQLMKKAADAGYLDAMALYGIKLYIGDGIQSNPQEALNYLKNAADNGQPEAMYTYGIKLYTEEYIKGKKQEGIKYLKMGAEKQSIDAMVAYARILKDGDGVQKDIKEAVRLYKEAAKTENATALNELGVMYQIGQDVPKDYKESVRLFKLASEKGNAQAMYNYAFMLENGFGCQSNSSEAYRYYKMAADNGNFGAMKKVEQLKNQDDCLIA